MSAENKIRKIKDIPTGVRIDNFRKGIVQMINESELPFCVLDLILGNIYNEVHTLSVEQTRQDLEEYNALMGLKKTDPDSEGDNKNE